MRVLCSLVMTPARGTAGSATPSLLHDAAAAGDAKAVDLLLSLGDYSCDEHNDKASTPLHMAARHGHAAVVEVLLSHGANVNAANNDGMTPLHAAVAGQQHLLTKLLLSRGAEAERASSAGLSPLRIAAQRGDAAMISALREGGAEMDEQCAQSAFWAAVNAVEGTAEGEALSAEVPRLLQHVFDADLKQLLGREKLTTNVTCMQPAKSGVEGVAAGLGYIFDYDAHANLKLKEGRRCEGGECCDACSRVTFPTFATASETDFEVFPGLEAFSFDKCAWSDARTILIALM